MLALTRHVFFLRAHPKLDPRTGELLFFGYQVEQQPYCQFAVVDSGGALAHQVDIGLKEPVMMHDFAITETRAILLDLPVVFEPKEMVRRECTFLA